MSNLDYKTFRLLKKLCKLNDYIRNPKTREFNELHSAGFLERNLSSSEMMYSDKPALWKINDKGKKQFLLQEQDNKRWRVPVVISIVALIIATIALIVSLIV